MMRIERFILMTLVLTSSIVAAIFWRKASLFQGENEKLRGEVAQLEEDLSALTNSQALIDREMHQLRKQTTELMTLRNEVTQLRSSAKNAETLASELQRLRTETQQLKSASTAVNAPTGASNPGFSGRDRITRDTWSFAGYGSPEDALVSAIWAMKEGNPRTYLDSLSPQEQQRMAENWKSKTEQEIAQKHQSDVSQITGLRILDRQNVSPNEVVMNVYLEGPNQLHKIRMNQSGPEWKFGGFIREQAGAQAK